MKRNEMYVVFANTVNTMGSLEKEIKEVAHITGDLETTIEFFARGYEMTNKSIFEVIEIMNKVVVELTGGIN